MVGSSGQKMVKIRRTSKGGHFLNDCQLIRDSLMIVRTVFYFHSVRAYALRLARHNATSSFTFISCTAMCTPVVTSTWAGNFDCSICRRKRLVGDEFSKKVGATTCFIQWPSSSLYNSPVGSSIDYRLLKSIAKLVVP